MRLETITQIPAAEALIIQALMSERKREGVREGVVGGREIEGGLQSSLCDTSELTGQRVCL